MQISGEVRPSSQQSTGNEGFRTIVRILRDVRQDLRIALRHHIKAPSLGLLIVMTLAVGIGANVTMVGAIEGLLLRAPPQVTNPDRVARILFFEKKQLGSESVSASSNYPTFKDLERDVPSFKATAAYASWTVAIGEGAEAIEAHASFVSPGFFSVFGTHSALGRLFAPGDGDSGAPIAVIGYGFWQREFAGDSSIVGRKIRIGSLSYLVVGVAARGFRGVEAKAPDVWLPMEVAAEIESKIPLSLTDRGSRWLSIVAQLPRNDSRRIAEQQATNVWRQSTGVPESGQTVQRIGLASVIPGRGPDRPREVNVAIWLTAISAFLLLIACANVANLLLARAIGRKRETAVRIALGASRGRLASQFIAEGLLVATFGGIAALFLAILGGSLLRRYGLADDPTDKFLDIRLFAFAAAVAIGVGMLVNIAPLLQCGGFDAFTSLRGGTNSGGKRETRLRSALVTTQAALSVMLLIAAGLFAQSLRHVEGLDLGMDIDRTLVVRINPGEAILSVPQTEATYSTMLRTVRAIPGVNYAALAEKDPYLFGRAVPAHTPTRSFESIWKEGALQVPMEADVDSGFFHAIGAVGSLAGRDFDAGDRIGAPRVAIINEPLSRLLWPGEKSLGKCMLVTWEGEDCVTIVGVLRGYWKQSILQRDRLVVYFPMAQNERFVTAGSMFIGTTGNSDIVASAVRGGLQHAGADMPAVSVTPMREIIAPELRPWRLGATMFELFGVVAFVIAMVGLYGVVSFSVEQRSSELAIRIALGAPTLTIVSGVVRDGLRGVLLGVVIGCFAALAARQRIAPLLFQTSASDPVIILGVGALFLLVGTIAALVPTFRVLRLNPAVVMRQD